MFASLMPDLIGIEAGPMRSIELAQAAGFTGIDMRLNRFTDEVVESGVETVRRSMRDAGLRPGYCSITPQKIGVADAEWRASMTDLPRRAEVARSLGYARATSVVLPFSDELDWDSNERLHIDRIGEAAGVLGEFGIRFGVEYVSPLSRRKGKPHEFVHTLGQTLAMLDKIGGLAVGVMLDSFHWECAGETAEDLSRLDPARVIAVHLNDFVPDRPVDEQTVTERLLPGESGLIRLDEFVRGLRACGYTGPMTSEPTHARWAGMDALEAAKLTGRAVRACIEPVGARRT